MKEFRTNLNTNLLKLVAVGAMTLDHVDMFFPDQAVALRWIGRLAFPIFCYCLTVGMVYTRDIKKYLGRLLLFAAVSQVFYVMALYDPYNFTDYLLVKPNIFFTLTLSLLAMWGLREKKWWWTVLAVLPLAFLDFDYGLIGVGMMLIFYYCRKKPGLGAGLYIIYCVILALLNGSRWSPLSLKIGSIVLGFEIFMILAAPLIFIRWPEVKLKINKWFFYAYYPAHLFVILVARIYLGV